MEYDNLVVSCKTEGINATCGLRKDLEAYADMIQYFYDRGDFDIYES